MAAGFDHARGRRDRPDGRRPAERPGRHPAPARRSSTRGSTSSAAGGRTARTASSRRLPSRIANWLIGRVTGVRLHDYGCTLKAYRAEVVEETRLYGEMHRFLPALAHQAGARSPRSRSRTIRGAPGRSKYGLGRTFKVLLDLLTVKFLSVCRRSRSTSSAAAASSSASLGSLFVAWTAYQRLVQRRLRLPQPVAARRRLPLHDRAQPDPARACSPS